MSPALWHSKWLLAMVVLGALTSCESALRVVVTPEISEFVPLLAGGAGTPPVELEDPSRPGNNVLRLTTSPGWNLPPGSAGNRAIPATEELQRAWPLPASLTALGKEGEGWTALPLFYDLWGVTTFVSGPQLAASAPVEWATLISDPSNYRVAGGSVAFRQAALLFGSEVPSTVPQAAQKWFRQPVAPWTVALDGLPTLLSDRRWVANTWSFSRADLEIEYQAGSRSGFVETYQQFSKANPPGTRAFTPLVSRRGQFPTYVGRVVFVEYRGSSPEQAAKALVAVLSSPAVKRAGQMNKWLAASPVAPEVDGTGAGLRQLLSRPSTLWPVTERLPLDLNEDELFSAVQIKFETTPKR